MKRWFRILWARVRCNAYCLWRLLTDIDNAVCEATFHGKDGKIMFVAAVRSNFLTLVDHPSGGMRFEVNLAAIDKLFYNEKP